MRPGRRQSTKGKEEVAGRRVDLKGLNVIFRSLNRTNGKMSPLSAATSLPEPHLILRPLTDSEWSAAEAIFKAVFPAKYNLEFLDAWKLRCSLLSFGAFTKEDGTEDGSCRLVGFLLTNSKGGGTEQRIEFLGVDPYCQKGGVGTHLLRHMLEHCRRTKSRATLIPVNDQRIIQWYKKHGFTETGQPFVSNYTGDVEQLMELSYCH